MQVDAHTGDTQHPRTCPTPMPVIAYTRVFDAALLITKNGDTQHIHTCPTILPVTVLYKKISCSTLSSTQIYRLDQSAAYVASIMLQNLLNLPIMT